MRIPDPIPDELTVKQVADRWRVKYQNPADENYVLACYGRLQFCKVDLPSMRLVNYSRDEIIAQVKKECSLMEHHDFVRDLPQYEKTMLRVRKNDLLAFEAGVGDKQPESATVQVEPAPALKTSNAEMLGKIQADIRAKLAYRADKIPARIYGKGCTEEQEKETTLTRYLKLETWTPIEAAMLVCGLMPPPDCHEIPKGTMGLENAFVMPYEDRFHHTKEVLNLWNHRESPPDKIRPADFVEWCKTKGINTDWLRDIEAAAPQPEIAQDGKGRRDKQIAAILKHGKSLCYNMKLVPYGGKSKIEKLCLEESQLFTKDGFKNAWQEARARGLLDVEGVDKYRKPA